jgi:F-type H+-transporting ATPase subunit b
MHIDWWTLALQVVNFAVLVWLLQRFLYRPVMRVLDERRKETDRAVLAAEEARRAAEQEAAVYRDKAAALDEERQQVLETARAATEDERQRVLAEAKREAGQFLERERSTIAAERAQALRELKDQALTLTTTLCQALLRETVHGAMAAAFLERLDERLGVLAAGNGEGWRELLGDGGSAAVVTAPPLTSAEQARWRERLAERLGASCAISFASDDALIAGARIELPGGRLEASWQSALDRARNILINNAGNS